MHWTPQGASYNDFMGVLIAFPKKKYVLKRFQQIIPGLNAYESEPPALTQKMKTTEWDKAVVSVTIIFLNKKRIKII